jgi:hypothetical protein
LLRCWLQYVRVVLLARKDLGINLGDALGIRIGNRRRCRNWGQEGALPQVPTPALHRPPVLVRHQGQVLVQPQDREAWALELMLELALASSLMAHPQDQAPDRVQRQHLAPAQAYVVLDQPWVQVQAPEGGSDLGLVLELVLVYVAGVAQARVRVQARLLLLALDQGLEVVQVLDQVQSLLQVTVQAPITPLHALGRLLGQMKEEAQDQVQSLLQVTVQAPITLLHALGRLLGQMKEEAQDQVQSLLQVTVQSPITLLHVLGRLLGQMKEEAQDQVHDIEVTKDTTDA